MRKVTIPTKSERAEAPRESGQGEAAPRQRLGLKYGVDPDARSRP